MFELVNAPFARAIEMHMATGQHWPNSRVAIIAGC